MESPAPEPGSLMPPPPTPPTGGTPPPPPARATIPGLGAAVRSCLAPLLGYAVAVGASLILMILVVIGIAVSGGGSGDEDPTSDIDIEAVTTLVGMPFQLAGMALGGTLGFGDGEFGLGLFAPPLLITGVFVAAVFILSRRAERSTPSGSSTERVILAISGAVATATVATLVTRLLAMRDDGEVMHAASVGLFFGTLILASAAAILGRQSAVGSLWPSWLPADARRAAHLVTQHLFVWTVLVIPVAFIWLAISSGLESALYALVWGPTVAFGAFALGHLGAITFFGDNAMAWELGWTPGIVLPLLAIALTVVVAIAWHLRRREDPSVLENPATWISLPVAYATLGLAVCLLSTVGLTGSLFGVSGGLYAHNAYWLILVLAAWGAAVEALSRFVVPRLVPAIPPPIVRRLGAGPAHLVSPVTAPAVRIPMSPADRARAKHGLIGLAVVGGVALVGALAISIVGSAVYSPEKQAEAYLDAIVDADLGEALQQAPVDEDEASTDLLNNEIYAATPDRITGYEITDVDQDGDTATITVDLEGVDDGDDVELTMESDGGRAVFFNDWKVADGGLAREVSVSIPDNSSTLTVDGGAISVDAGEDAELWALPGSYAFNPYGDSEWLEVSDVRTTVAADDTWGLYAEIGEPEPSEALKDKVDADLEAWLTACMASTEAEPADCPQDAYLSDDVRNISWALTATPTISWDGFYGTFPADLSTDTDGEATVTYEEDASYGFGKPEWVEESDTSTLFFRVGVDLVDGEPVVSFDSY